MISERTKQELEQINTLEKFAEYCKQNKNVSLDDIDYIVNVNNWHRNKKVIVDRNKVLYGLDGKHEVKEIGDYMIPQDDLLCKPQKLKRGYITNALTCGHEIFGMIKDCSIEDWSQYIDLYWSEVYCEPGHMAQIIRTGMLLNNLSNEELSILHEQSKINLNTQEE